MMYEKEKQAFAEVIEYSQNINNPKVDEIFNEWQVAKARFITAFGGNLIWESSDIITLHLDEAERTSRIDDFVSMLEGSMNFPLLAEFIDEVRNDFFDNKLSKTYFANENIRIQKGTKIVKAFKHFIKDPVKLTAIQNHASMLIQEDKVEGVLCLSVHPLDFLSLSENRHNWTSCQSVDGDYRGGTLSYMKDSSTVICYLKSVENVSLAAFPNKIFWNSKKWRVLLHFSNDNKLLLANKAYPFASDECLRHVLEEVLPSVNLGSTKWSSWNTWKNSDGLISVEEKTFKLRHMVVNEECSLHFNDLIPAKRPKYSYQPEINENSKIYIGGRVNCMSCGENLIILGETMLCEDCLSKAEEAELNFCSHCGREIEEEYNVCDACLHEFFVPCENCLELIEIAEAVTWEHGKYLCADCAEDLKD